MKDTSEGSTMKSTLLFLLFGLLSMSKLWYFSPLIINLIWTLGYGLKCQVCDGQCINESDNGESKECDSTTTACWYLKTNQGVIGRLCGPKLADQCVIDDFFGVTVCNCDTDNCNKDDQCSC